MWEIVGDHYRHAKFPQWEIHDGTQGSRFELRNTEKGTRAPLFADCPNANIHTVMDVADEAICDHMRMKAIEDDIFKKIEKRTSGE